MKISMLSFLFENKFNSITKTYLLANTLSNGFSLGQEVNWKKFILLHCKIAKTTTAPTRDSFLEV